jgi:hypothetical protein
MARWRPKHRTVSSLECSLKSSSRDELKEAEVKKQVRELSQLCTVITGPAITQVNSFGL